MKKQTRLSSWAYFWARVKVALRHFYKACHEKWRAFVRFLRQKFFGEEELMALRHDYCPNPEAKKAPRYTVVFLHGISSSFDTWEEIVASLEKDEKLADLRFIGFDLIGYGHSPSPKDFNYTFEDYRQVLDANLKKLHIKSPIILVGHSMGALISMDYTLTHPERIAQLVMVSPPILRKAEIGSFSDKLRQKVYAKIGEGSEQENMQKLADALAELIGFDNISFKTPAFKKCMENIILNEYNWRRAFALQTPTLIVHGRFDPLVVGENLRNISNRKPRVNFVSTMGAHNMTGQKAERIVALLRDLLAAS